MLYNNASLHQQLRGFGLTILITKIVLAVNRLHMMLVFNKRDNLAEELGTKFMTLKAFQALE